ncbi:MAG: hypothetical protein Q7T55_12060, partial [Solirubrobacteraceae bacterium]|nr:hypothetical protein [Solirubrobacteraceae bacterium]
MKAFVAAVPWLKPWQFLTGARWLTTLNLGSPFIRELGDDFLSGSTVKNIRLPKKLKAVGNRFLANTQVVFLDLAGTSLVRVGDDFLASTPIRKVSLPGSFAVFGRRFLADCPNFTTLNLAETAVQSVPDLEY